MVGRAKVKASGGAILLSALGALLLAWLMLLLFPTGFGGGPIDDQRYLDAALHWVDSPPYVGTTHWALRLPLVLPLATLLASFGKTIAVAMTLPVIVSLLFAFVNFAFIARATDRFVAALWAVMFLTSPLWVRISGSLLPESIELLMVTLAVWTFYFGQRSPRRPLLFLISGICAAFAIMTRETSAWLVLFYGFHLLTDRRNWLSYAWIAVPAVLILGFEWTWLYLETHDPLYRIHVDMNHVNIPSTNMEGGTFKQKGEVLFNPALAEKWKPVGLFHIHWTVNPLLGLFADPKYGLIPDVFVLLFALALLRDRRRPAPTMEEALGIVRFFMIAAIISFVLITYVLVLSQDQRYYSFVIYAFILCAAALLAALWRQDRKLLFWLLLLGSLASNLALTSQMGRFDGIARAAMAMVRDHPGVKIHTSPFVYDQIRTRLAEDGLADRVTTDKAPAGGLVLAALGYGTDCQTVGGGPDRKVIDCRQSDYPLGKRVIKTVAPNWKLPDALDKGGITTTLARMN